MKLIPTYPTIKTNTNVKINLSYNVPQNERFPIVKPTLHILEILQLPASLIV